MQRVEGEIELVECSACGASFPTFVFSGDMDSVTFGLEAATSVEPPFVVLGELNEDELSAGYSPGRELFAKRMGRLFGALLTALEVARWVEGPSGEGMTFQQFRQVYRPSEPIYRCPKCGEEATVRAKRTPAGFVSEGGRLELSDGLSLA